VAIEPHVDVIRSVSLSYEYEGLERSCCKRELFTNRDFGSAVELILISDEVQPLHRPSYVTNEDSRGHWQPEHSVKATRRIEYGF
jgi:hypothetical protein